MKALVVDDEERARNLLKTILTEYCHQVSEVLEAKDLPQAVGLIKNLQPNIVFMDIEMPGYLGTQILDFFEESEVNFHLIFATAYSEHAVKAFEMNAIDYLLKPLRPKQVKDAINKVLKIHNQQSIQNQMKELKTVLSGGGFSKIGLPVADGLLFLEFDQIICMEADGMYTKVFSTSNSPQLVSKPLKHFAELLSSQPQFYRPHRSWLINIKHLKQFVRKDGNYIVMDNNQLVSISKEKRDEFLDLVKSL